MPGVGVNFPMCKPTPLVEIQKQLEFISLVLPPWLRVFLLKRRCACPPLLAPKVCLAHAPHLLAPKVCLAPATDWRGG